jgi:hypothetical protein
LELLVFFLDFGLFILFEPPASGELFVDNFAPADFDFRAYVDDFDFAVLNIS